MTTRFDAKDEVNYGVQGIKSGYDGLRSDFSIPSCGIEDVDVAIFNLFEKEIMASVVGQDAGDLKKVPVLFAAGEKWAMLKRGEPLRDKVNTLIIPLITIARIQVSQDAASDTTGRGINQQTGEIVVRRRLSDADRNYQNLINRMFIENQKNAAVSPSDSHVLNQLLTDREVGKDRDADYVKSGALLRSNRKNNIYETIVVPSPQFYNVTYEVNVWTQYTQHANQIMEKIVSSLLPQGRCWKLLTTKGYWFVANLESDFQFETNFEDMSTAERYIKQKFTVKVPAYFWATTAPGAPIPVKRYVSSPIINFEINTVTNLDIEVTTTLEDEAEIPNEVNNNLILGSDDPTLPLELEKNSREDQRYPGWNLKKVVPSNSKETIDMNDPALKTYPRGYKPSVYKKISLGNGKYKYVKIIKTNEATGETVYSAADLSGL
jgi:hypothetical protein